MEEASSTTDLRTPQLTRALSQVLRVEVSPSVALQELTMVYESIREDPSRLDLVLESMRNVDAVAGFTHLLERNDVDKSIGDKAAFVLSGLISRAPSYVFETDSVAYFVKGILQSGFRAEYPLSSFGRLDALANILKLDTYREIVWQCRRFPELLLDNLRISSFGSPTSGASGNSNHPAASNVYKAAFCVWLLTFNRSFIPRLNAKGLTASICSVIIDTRIEKIVRVCLNTLKNLLHNDDAAEILIEMDVFQVLTLLEYEKWKDLDLYEEIRGGIHQLDQKIKHFSNFDRYCLELEKSKLKWSVLHSEKFWRENVMSFEHEEFTAVRKLVRLLESVDATTVAVAAYDLGEFARLHPAGKKVCQKLKVKDIVMLLITNGDRTVAREALLCIQKLMLKNWQAVAGQ